jgi:hypothetical protein
MQDVVSAHKCSSNHRAEILSSERCGCFHCLATFKPGSIEEWVDWPLETPEGQECAFGTTAMCPMCGIDSVIGSASGYPITNDFLAQMKKHWFDD